jgi:hypothetical protein
MKSILLGIIAIIIFSFDVGSPVLWSNMAESICFGGAGNVHGINCTTTEKGSS